MLKSIAARLGLPKRFEKEAPVMPKTGRDSYREDGEMTLRDAYVAPWFPRAKFVLAYYRRFKMPKGVEFDKWVERLCALPACAKSCSTNDAYIYLSER